MPTSLVSTGVQFPDSTIQTTAAAASGTFSAVASGAISAGDEIVVNSAGTVSKVAGATNSVGSNTQYAAASSAAISIYDSVNSRMIVGYSNGSNGFVVIGTISGGVTTWGTPTSFGTDVNNSIIGFAYDSANTRFVFSWQTGGGVAKAIAGTISGSTITVGTIVTVKSFMQNGTSVAYHPASSRFVLVCNDFTAPNYPIAFVLSLSGTTITVNAFVNITTAYNTFNGATVQVVYDPISGNVVWCAREGNSGNVISAVGSVSSTTTTWGAAASIGQNSQIYYLDYESISQKMMLIWTLNSTAEPYATVYSISGTSLTLNTAVKISTTPVNNVRFCSNTVVNKVYFLTRPTATGYPSYVLGSISGTTSTWETLITIVSTNYATTGTLFYTAVGVVVNFIITAGTGYSFTQVVPYTNLTATNFIGFSGAAYANGATATVQTVGSRNTNQSSLTPGLQYYVQIDGALSTTPGSPSVLAGTAVSATSILIKG